MQAHARSPDVVEHTINTSEMKRSKLMAVLSDEMGKRLCQVLDLPAGSKAVSINFSAGKPVTATVMYYPSKDQVVELVEVLAEYELVEKGAKEIPVTGDTVDVTGLGDECRRYEKNYAATSNS